MKLSEQSCSSCRKDTPRVEHTEQSELLKELPQWTVVYDDELPKLTREYHFKDFKQALAFTNRVGEMAEQENHHPSITTEWGKVTLYWWTHTIQGLHKNDFILAARSDELLAREAD